MMSGAGLAGTHRTLPAPGGGLVGEVLHFLRMRGTLYCRSEFTAPWGVDFPAMPESLMFHIVTAGECWLAPPRGVPVHLRPGGFALVPHGAGHRLLSSPRGRSVRLFDLPVERVSEHYEVLRHGGGGAPATLICGAVQFDHPAASDLVRLLPPVIAIDSWSAPEEAEWMQTTLRFIASEAQRPRTGGEAVITRLADILVIQGVRSWIAANPRAWTGWLGALRDPRLGRVIQSIHREPGRAWTVESMAEVAGMSRSAFAARFTALAGEPAMRFLVRWRMNLAYAALADGRQTIAALAADLGYESEAAFARAFRRVLGCWPGEAKARCQQPSQADLR